MIAMSSSLSWILVSAWSASPWAVPALPDPGEPHVMQICRDDEPLLAHRREGPPPESPSTPARTGEDQAAAIPKSRHANATALIAGGAVLLGAGTALRVPAPAYWEIDTKADPSVGDPTVKMGMSTGNPGATPGNVALGTVGAILQAAGVGMLRRGIDLQRRR
jgi:hypothetical protein